MTGAGRRNLSWINGAGAVKPSHLSGNQREVKSVLSNVKVVRRQITLNSTNNLCTDRTNEVLGVKFYILSFVFLALKKALA